MKGRVMDQWLHSFNTVESIMLFGSQVGFGLALVTIVCIEIKDTRKERKNEHASKHPIDP